MAHHPRISTNPATRVALPALLAIALLIGFVGNGLAPAHGSAPATASPREETLAGGTIPNLTAVKTRIVSYHDSGAWDADSYRVPRQAGAAPARQP